MIHNITIYVIIILMISILVIEWSSRLETAAKQMEDSNCIDLESVYQCSENSIAIIQQLVSLERNPLRQV